MRATVIAILFLPLLLGACVLVVDADDDDDGRYTDTWADAVDARGARFVEIDGEAGELVVRGGRGLADVRVEATARASSRRVLDDIRVTLSRRGDIVYVDADVPPGLSFAELDLVIEVPFALTVIIDDTSGDVLVEHVGAVDVEDGSGDIVVRDIGGNVVIGDGSGEIGVYGVGGDVRVREDGSGNIIVVDVDGSVLVEEDGSGDIDVSNVAGDFTVERDGSGRIRYHGIGGRVRLP